jgi:hypothetical protein
MLIYRINYNFFYKRKDGSLLDPGDNPHSISVKSNENIEDNIFKKYLKSDERCYMELLDICYEDLDKMISYDDILEIIRE